MPGRRSTILAVCASATLVTFSTATSLSGLGAWWVFAANLALAALAVGACTFVGGTDDLGLDRRTVRRSVALGALIATMPVAGSILYALTIGRGAPADPEIAMLSVPALLIRVLVVIPIGTALAEELLFRGVLLAWWRRVVPTRSAVVLTSVAFGLWHIGPEWRRLGPGAASLTVLPAVVFTATISALVLCPLRLRTRSIAAPVVVHAATNAAFLVASWWLATSSAR